MKLLDMNKSEGGKGEGKFCDNQKYSLGNLPARDNVSLHNLYFCVLYPFDEILYRTRGTCAACAPSAFSDGRLT